MKIHLVPRRLARDNTVLYSNINQLRSREKMSGVESDYSSSSDEDDDYVPSGEDDSYDELEGTVEEEEGIQEIDGGKKPKQKGTKDSTNRRRKAWTALVEEGEEDDDEAQNEVSNIQREFEEAKKEEAKRKREEAEKKKADDLWSSFMSDVKPKSKSSQSQNGQPNKTVTPSSQKSSSSKKSDAPISQSNGSKASTLKITKVFDFAGESVKVTKEVSASSKEAKSYLKEQETKDTPASSNPLPSSSSSRSTIEPGSLGSTSKPTVSSGLKRSGGGLGGVLGQIGKKQKISTLEKSCLDWESFKSAEGITEDLKTHNKGKDGFVEKQRFLQRADVRQYEIERDLRMAQSKILR